jgi:hypothetical protein
LLFNAGATGDTKPGEIELRTGSSRNGKSGAVILSAGAGEHSLGGNIDIILTI